MKNRTSWVRWMGGIAGIFCLSQAWAATLTCVELSVRNNSEATLLNAVQGYLADAEAVYKDDTGWLDVTGLGSKSGTWEYNGDGMEVIAYILKGGPGAVLCFLLEDGALVPFSDKKTHGWDSVTAKLPEVGNGNTPGLSYFAVVTRSKSVPEPSSILAGLMALGMGMMGWNRMRRIA